MQIEKLHNIEYKGKAYVCKFPNIGQFRAIQVLQNKALPQIEDFFEGNSNQEFSAVSTEAEANLSIMCPELFKDLGAFSELDIVDAMDVVELWVNDVRIWYTKQFNLIASNGKEQN